MNNDNHRSSDGAEADEYRVPKSHEDGHFYSPICDPRQLKQIESRLWPEFPKALGIDFNDAYHRRVLTRFFPRHFGNYRYPETLDEGEVPGRFYTRNSQFSWLDARALFVLLNEWKPRRMIEVGSGYSSLLAADVNRTHLGGKMEFTCIEPYPRDFLNQSIDGLTRLLVSRVEEVELGLFRRLGPGDVLFIDSSHVAKTGSDVNYLYFEVLPRLKRGVRVHIHDIFLPAEYPKDWVLTLNRSWNEQYLLRALLMHSRRFKVLFGSNYAVLRFPKQVCRALGVPLGQGFGGGSFWIQRRRFLG